MRELTLLPNPSAYMDATKAKGAFTPNVSSRGQKLTSFEYAVEVVDVIGRQYMLDSNRTHHDCKRANTRLLTLVQQWRKPESTVRGIFPNFQIPY